MFIMSAGPTSIPQRVRQAMVRDFTNTDLDENYIAIHKATEQKVSKLLKTGARSFLMLGEAMLGLDGACASFTEPGARVLVLANGIFGEGFADFVRMYGGEPVMLKFDERHGISPEELERFLKKDDRFTYATMIHCETPTGVSNDITRLGQILNNHGILSVVDSVSGLVGEDIDFDAAKIDCLIGGTQKCLSAPAGLTTITLSPRAEEWLAQRETPIAGFYANFKNYLKSGQFAFPYTPCDNLVYALDEALDIAMESHFAKRHRSFAERTRKAIDAAGLERFALSFPSNTVTGLLLPEWASANDILADLQERGYLLSGGIAHWDNRIIRIGHMGNNIADEALYIEMLEELSRALTDADLPLRTSLADAFCSASLDKKRD